MPPKLHFPLLTINELLHTTQSIPFPDSHYTPRPQHDGWLTRTPSFHPHDPLLQDQYKFIYDTLEEFVQCGYTYFPVKEISQALRDKSKKQEGGKRVNQYEKEYVVRRDT